MRGCLSGSIAVLALTLACSSKPAVTTVSDAGGGAPPEDAAKAPAVAMRSQVVGHVRAPSGTVVVILTPKIAHAFPPQDDKPVMDQAGLSFAPEVLIVRTGQPVEFRNSDEEMHNVNVSEAETHEPAFNVVIPTGRSYEFTFTHDGFYHVACDVHPAMSATILASSSPYAALAAPDGSFTFADVAPGAYTMTVYSGGKRADRDVDVRGETTEVSVG